jgi:hypothetical protein
LRKGLEKEGYINYRDVLYDILRRVKGSGRAGTKFAMCIQQRALQCLLLRRGLEEKVLELHICISHKAPNGLPYDIATEAAAMLMSSVRK